jgi:mannan endo-1,4-beta-mannosidase
MTLTRRIGGTVLAGAMVAAAVLFNASSALAATTPSKPAPPAATLGIYSGGAASAGQHPNIANEYFAWGDYDISSFLNSAHAQGATPFIELEPWTESSQTDCTVSMTGIGSNNGSDVSYEQNLGAEIASFGHPVIVTFAHEFNVSGQYPWAIGGGCDTTPAQWIAAWQKVVTNVNSTAGSNAYWMWAPNADTGGSTEDPSAWWPGSNYVDMVGVDGYPDIEWGSQFGTFSGEFGPVFSEIRGLGWSGPIFISETNLVPLDSSGYESLTGFLTDLLNAGGSGVLEFEDPSWNLPSMSSKQWTELDSVLGSATTPPPGQTPVLSGGKATNVTNNGAVVSWNSTVTPGKWSVKITGPGPINGQTNTVGITQATYSGLEAGHTYTVTVQQLNPTTGKAWGASGQVVFVTK